MKEKTIIWLDISVFQKVASTHKKVVPETSALIELGQIGREHQPTFHAFVRDGCQPTTAPAAAVTKDGQSHRWEERTDFVKKIIDDSIFLLRTQVVQSTQYDIFETLAALEPYWLVSRRNAMT